MRGRVYRLPYKGTGLAWRARDTRLVSIAILNLDEAGEPGPAPNLAVLIATTSLLMCILYLGVGWLVERRTQTWRKPA